MTSFKWKGKVVWETENSVAHFIAVLITVIFWFLCYLPDKIVKLFGRKGFIITQIDGGILVKINRESFGKIE
jgi:hypothetical protein